MNQKILSLTFICFVLFGMTGCINENTTDDSVVYSYTWLASFGALIASVVVFSIGYSLRETTDKALWIMAVGAGGGLLLVPGYFFDYVEVTRDKVVAKRMFLFIPSTDEINFSVVKRVNFKSEVSYRRRGKSTNTYLKCTTATGKTTEFKLNSKLCEEALPMILLGLYNNNVQFFEGDRPVDLGSLLFGAGGAPPSP